MCSLGKSPLQLGDFNFSVIELHFDPVDRNYTFYGSYYRGMLGRSLKRRFCILKNADCSNCPLRDKCLYILSFEGNKDVLFPPYTINRCARDMLRLTLVGSFTDLSEVYINAFKRHLSVKEIGFVDILTGELVSDARVFNSSAVGKLNVAINKIEVEVWRVRIKKSSHMMSCEELNFLNILSAVEKRLHLINKFYGSGDSGVYLPDVDLVDDKVGCNYEKVKRYSQRKRKIMYIPSMNCKFVVSGNVFSIYPYLYLASFVNVGTNASMGFGQVKLHSLS